MSEQQVAEQLNLDAGVVMALERDDYAALGAPVFVRGHLKRYAALLALSEDEVVGAYERSRAQLAQPTLIPKAREEMLPVRGRPKWPWLVGGVVAFLLAAGIAAYVGEHGLGFPARSGTGTADDSTASDAAPTPGGSNAAPSAGGPSATPAADTAARQSSPASTTPGAADPSAAPGPPAGQVALQLAFAADSWVEVYDGAGKAVLYDLGKAGTGRTVTGAAPLSITVGNAPAVSLRVNGQPLALPPPPAGQTVARFSIGPDGSLR